MYEKKELMLLKHLLLLPICFLNGKLEAFAIMSLCIFLYFDQKVSKKAWGVSPCRKPSSILGLE